MTWPSPLCDLMFGGRLAFFNGLVRWVVRAQSKVLVDGEVKQSSSALPCALTQVDVTVDTRPLAKAHVGHCRHYGCIANDLLARPTNDEPTRDSFFYARYHFLASSFSPAVRNQEEDPSAGQSNCDPLVIKDLFLIQLTKELGD